MAHALVDDVDAHLAEVRWYRLNAGTGYAVRTIYVDKVKTMQYLHRVVLGLAGGDEREGDHLNRNTLDCRRKNLRAVTHAVNMANLSAPRGRALPKNVYRYPDSKRLYVQLQVAGRTRFIGGFATVKEADKAARAARLKYRGKA